MSDEKLVRSPLLSGIFYPSDPDMLMSEMDNLSMYAKPMPCPAFAIIAPHGSFLYSGKVSMESWGAILGADPSIIAIMGPSHLPYEEGVFLPESTKFDIPGTSLNIDSNLRDYLLTKVTMLKKNDLPHLEEHSIELQLPFASRFFPGVPILPCIISGKNPSTIETATRLFEEISNYIGNQVVFVLSSNLAVSDSPEKCDSLSKEFVDSLSRPIAEFQVEAESCCNSFCGEAVIRAFRVAFPKARAELLDYDNSSKHREYCDELVVGYGAIDFKR